MTSFRLYWLIAASGLAARSALAQGMQSDIARACSVYCYGDILAAVQQSGIYNDSKTFVDMPMRADPEAVNAAFEGIDSSDEAQLRLFLDTYFDPAGSDLDEWLPPDLQEQPAFLSYIQDPVLRAWGSELNQLWRALGREVAASVAENPQRHSFLPRRYPMIVPGGRFRESYYWDTWWIVRGLLVCDMTLTARYVIDNLLDDVENFGFIPNGGRIYYLDRSQPPLLSEMVDSYITALGVQSENATAMLERAFPLLQAEYSWWMDPSNGHVVLVDGHVFNRYHSNGTLPRPESYAEDLATAASAAPRESADVYASIRGGAESGWDFSSRWIAGAAPKRDLAHIHSADIVPVELNSIMYRWELNMARFAGLLGEASSIALFYQSAASDRSAAVEAVLWQEDRLSDRRDDGLWYDFNITAGTSQKAVEDTTLSLSQWVPMWAGLAAGKDVEALLSTLVQNGFVQAGGLLTTLAADTDQQWDSPNAWAPLVLMTVEGMGALGIPGGFYLASNISRNWLNTNYLAFNRTGYMYEKYNAYELGVGGGGGEYTPQFGFGWTNGVALVLLNSTITVPPGQSGGDADEEISILMIILLSICGSLVLCGLLFFFTLRCFKLHSPNKTITEVVTGIISPPKRSRKDSYNPEGPVRPSNEITGRSGRSTANNDSASETLSNALIGQMTQSDDFSEQSAAYF